MFTKGTALTGGRRVLTNTSHDYKIGEYGIIINQTWQAPLLENWAIPTESQLCKQFIAEIEKQGAVVTYLKASSSVDWWGLKCVLNIQRCDFRSTKGNPVLIAVIVIIIMIALVVITFQILYPGVIYSWFGVTPLQVAEYNLAQFLNYIVFVVAIIVVVGVIYYAYTRRSKISSFYDKATSKVRHVMGEKI